MESMPRRLSPQSLRASFPLNSMRVSDPLQRFPIAMQSPGFSMCSLSTILGVLLEICSKCKQGILVITPSSFHHPSHHFCHLSPCFMFSCSHLPSVSISGRTDLIEMRIEGVSFGYTPTEPLRCKSKDLILKAETT